MKNTFDFISVGAGPAGISAALYAVRAGLKTAVIYKDGGALYRADKIENYYGGKITGKELFNAGVEQANELGVVLIKAEVTAISYDGEFTLEADGGYRTKALLLATGATRVMPRVKGLAEYEGAGVSTCAVCDGFFFRGRDVCVLGTGKYAYSEAQALLQMCKSVTILTNGEQPSVDFGDIKVIKDKIICIKGDERVTGVELTDGDGVNTLATAGIFVAVGVASTLDLARKLGAAIDGGKTVVGNDMETTVPGLFAAGDCISSIKQVSIAVGQGANAGLAAVRFIRNGKSS